MSVQSLVSLYDASTNGGMTEIISPKKLCGLCAITHFFAKTKPEHETSLLVGPVTIAKTNTYTFDPVAQMYEICFFSRIVNMIDLPDQYTKCFLIQKGFYEISILCEGLESVYVKMLPNKPIIDINSMHTYIEYVTPVFGQRCSVLSYSNGTLLPYFEHFENDQPHYHDEEKQLICQYDDKLKKYVPDAIILEEFKTDR
jgi:hypothetical protein